MKPIETVNEEDMMTKYQAISEFQILAAPVGHLFIAGGFLFLVAHGGGAYSLDSRARSGG